MSSEKISKSTLEAKANAGTFRENADGQLDASDLARLTNARLAVRIKLLRLGRVD